MKRRIIFVGRGGTVLITIGLALLLVSRMPSDSLASAFLCTHVPPKISQRANLQFYSASPGPSQPSYEILLTPQQGLRILIWTNSTIDVYILEISSQIFYQWVGYDILNVTDLEEFLEANPSVIGWSGEVHSGYIEHEYVPNKVTNATLVISNPSSEIAHVDVDITQTSRLARIKTRNLGQWTTPIGFVLSLPWLTQLWKRKTRRKLS
jgi:hypothetical protein